MIFSNRARLHLKNLGVTTNEFMAKIGPTISPEFDRRIEEAENAAEKKFNLDHLKDQYERLMRPELVFRLLVHSHPLKHGFTEWLNYQMHAKKKGLQSSLQRMMLWSISRGYRIRIRLCL